MASHYADNLGVMLFHSFRLGLNRILAAWAVLIAFAAIAIIVCDAGATIRFDAPLLTQLAGRSTLVPAESPFAIGDLNNDGNLDVICRGEIGTLVMYGQGDGTLTRPNSVAGRYSWLGTLNFDGYEPLDFVGGGPTAAELFVNIAGGLLYNSVYLTGETVVGLVPGDFNADGFSDVVVITQRPGSGFWLECDLSHYGEGYDPFSQPLDSLSSGPIAMRVADFNRDGRADFALTQTHGSNVLVALSNGDGSFTIRNVAFAPSGDMGGLDAVDLNGDGIADIVVASSNGIFILPGLGDGTFGAVRTVSPAPLHAFGVAAGDVTGDGIPDLVIPDLATGEICVRTGLGNFQFAQGHVTAVGRPLVPIALVDMNGDERLDLVARSVDQTHGVFVALNDGTGSFEPHVPRYFLPGSYVMAGVGDFDHDGLDDVVAAADAGGSNPKSVSILRGRSNRDLAPGPTQPYSGPIRDSYAVDLDEDGNLDVVIRGDASQLSWYRGNGDGTLQSPTLLSPTVSNVVRFADATGDGHLDIVTADGTAAKIYPGNGAGGFGPPFEIPVNGSVVDIAVGDVNGDSIPDVAVGWSHYDPPPLCCTPGISVELGNGVGGFVEVSGPSPSQGSVLGWIEGIADLKSNGRKELLVPSDTHPTVYDEYERFLTIASWNPDGGIAGSRDQVWPDATAPDPHPASLHDVSGTGSVAELFKLDAGFGVALADGSGSMYPESGYDGYEQPLYADGSNPSYSETHSIRSGDFNGDGLQDALLTAQVPGTGLTILWGRDPVGPTVDLLGPAPNARLRVGAPTSITWSATDNHGVESVDLFVSRHGLAGPYEVIARGIPNSGSYPWLVTAPPSDSVAFKVLARDSAGNTAWKRSNGILSISGTADVTSAPDLPRRLAIRSVSPNPSHGALAISFDLPHSGPASIALHDLQGRRVATLLEGLHPAGHAEFRVSLDRISPRVPAGLFFLVLRSGSDRAVTRVALTQ